MRERVCGFCAMHWRGGLGISRPSFGIDEKFCGRACLKAWEAKLAFSELEVRAVESMLPIMGQYVAESGIMAKPFGECSKDEILGLFAKTINVFRMKLAEEIDIEGVPF